MTVPSATPAGPPPAGRPVTAATLLARPGIAALSQARRYPTGFDVLDNVLGGGVGPRELVLLGGAPGVGKTTAALQWARSMALSGVVVVYASYQHDERDLLNRLLTMELAAVAEPADGPVGVDARVLLERLGRGGQKLPGSAGFPLVQRTAARLRSYGDRLVLLRASAATAVADLRHLLDERAGEDVVVFVDPLEKVPGSGAAAALRDTALALDVAVVAVTTAAAGTPAAAAAAGVAEADIVLMLREAAPSPGRSAGEVVISVEKNRRGSRSTRLRFREDLGNGRFEPVGEQEHRGGACGRIASLIARTRRLRA